jgi:DNA-binding XRE family transcriptional regulator
MRAHREAVRLTQDQAAVRSGLTRNTIVSIEGKSRPDPRLSTLLALMRTYGLGSLEELLGVMPSRALGQVWTDSG